MTTTERPQKRSSRPPPVRDPSLAEEATEFDAELDATMDELADIADRIDDVAKTIEALPHDGVVVAPLSDEDSLVTHVEAVHQIPPPPVRPETL